MKIVLLSYLNRSGSTFLINQLSKIPDICVCPEADILFELLLSTKNLKFKAHHTEQWIRLLELDNKFQHWQLPTRSIITNNSVGKPAQDLFFRILSAYRDKYYPDRNTIIYKQNYIYRIFNRLMPSDDIEIFGISLIRDPRAIYSSQKNTIYPITNAAMCENPLTLIRDWNRHILMLKDKYDVSNNYLYIKYEDVIVRFEDTLNHLLTFLRLSNKIEPFRENQPQHPKFLDSTHELMHPDINLPPLLDKLNSWEAKLSRKEIVFINRFICKNKFYTFPEDGKTVRLGLVIYFIILASKHSFQILIQSLRVVIFRIRANW